MSGKSDMQNTQPMSGKSDQHNNICEEDVMFSGQVSSKMGI